MLLLGENRDIFFPKLSEELHLTTFSEIAERYLDELGFEPYHCSTEEEARDLSGRMIPGKQWPCYFFESDTSGEKDFEEFFTEKEVVELDRFHNLGVIKNQPVYNPESLTEFLDHVRSIRTSASWDKSVIVELFNRTIPDFKHKETGKYLDERM